MWKKIILLALILIHSVHAQDATPLTWSDAPNMPIYWGFTPEQYPSTFQLGDQFDFPAAIPEFDNRSYTYELRYISDHAYFWFSPQSQTPELEAAAHFFETVTRPLNHDLYGQNPDESRLHIVHSQNLGFGVVGLYSAERHILYYALSWGELNSPEYLSTLTHEYQHVLRFAHDANEKRGQNEGFSLLAEHLAGFGLEHVLGANLNVFLKQPSLPLDAWAELNSEPAGYYAANFLFLVYLYEQFGQEWIQELSRSPYDGLAAVYRSLPAGCDLDTLFVDWAIANASNGYISLDQAIYVQPTPVFFENDAQVILSGGLPAYSAAYWALPAGDYALDFVGESQIALVEAETSGPVWWSYPQEFSAARLSLSLQGGGALDYRVWYELEKDFDFGKVMISLDAGQSWKDLQEPYTGRSGAWLSESLDLSPFAGQNIQVRFEVLSDGAYNHAGVLLDFGGAFAAADWQSEGFIWGSLLAPQTWSLVLIGEDNVLPLENGASFSMAEGGILMLASMSPLHTHSADYQLILEKR